MAKQVKWEMKLREARELRQMGTALLFDRVKLLCECYSDSEFLAWCEANEKVDLDFLDSEVEDVATDFLTLKAAIEFFPSREDWEKGNLRKMLAEVALKSKANDDDSTERVSWKKRALEAEKEVARLRKLVSELTQKIVGETVAA